tara:strand:+ start:383 stop:1318 length:936 start_codon:yes stop_codon:yes gene_type:complete
LKKAFKILLIGEDSLGLREYNITPKHFYISIFFLITILSSFLFLFSDSFSNFAYKNKLSNIKDENKQLQEIIESQELRIEKFYKDLESIKEQGEIFRKIVKLPPINDDVRRLGTGGSQEKDHSSHLEYLLPKKTNLNEMKKRINHLNRLLNLESLSYFESYEEVLKSPEIYKYIPAIHPVDRTKGRFSSGYGYRRDPFDRKYRFHDGDDFSAKIGTPVVATADGIVKKSKYWGTYGNYIEIDHGNGYRTVFAHLSKRKVKAGDKVLRGQTIGKVGNTGKSTASHLHYEIKKFGKNINPKDYYYDVPIGTFN